MTSSIMSTELDNDNMDVENSQDLRPLVQAPMESPLNRAHTFSRRAEMLTKSKRYDEAISCLSKAGECVLLAMKGCLSQTILDSLSLQHKSYLSQIDRLRNKAKLVDLLENTHKTIATITQSTQTDSVHSVCADQSSAKVEEDVIYEVLRENQHLLKRFIKMSSDKDQQVSEMSDKSYKSVNLCESDSSDGLGSEKSQNSWKFLNNAHSCSEMNVSQCDNLLQMNQRLSQCVTSLLQELSTTHAEKKKIEERLAIVPMAEPFACLNFPPLDSLYPEVGHFSSSLSM